MCMFVPKDATPRQRASCEALGLALDDAMAAALSKWTEEEWDELERGIKEDEAHG